MVNGPLIATLLLDLLNRKLPAARVRHFTFKAVSPLIDIYPFSLHMKADGDGRMALWALNHEGALAMSAQVQLGCGADGICASAGFTCSTAPAF